MDKSNNGNGNGGNGGAGGGTDVSYDDQGRQKSQHLRKNSSSMSFKGYKLPYIRPHIINLSKPKQAEILKEQEQEQEQHSE